MMSAEMIVMVAPEDKDCIHEPILFNGGPMGTFDNVWRYFWLSQLGGKGCAATGWRLGRLLNIPQCTGWPSTTQNCPTPNINRAKAVKPWSTPGTLARLNIK